MQYEEPNMEIVEFYSTDILFTAASTTGPLIDDTDSDNDGEVVNPWWTPIE